MESRVSRRDVINMGGSALAAALMAGVLPAEAAGKRRVVVWCEGTAKSSFYPNDVAGAIAEGLKPLKGWEVLTAYMNQPDQGLPADLLKSTDVLIWWGHQKHGDVRDDLVDAIVKRVQEDGMGFIATHSSHFSKPFQRVLGASGAWGNYVGDNSKVEVIVALPKHPICRGLKSFTCPRTERYSEPFQVPEPEAVPLDGEYTLPNGTKEKSRHGLCWTRGKGRVFYFQIGHESEPMYLQPEVQLVFRNAVQWCAPRARR